MHEFNKKKYIMTREEKIKRIQELETIKTHYSNALDLINGESGHVELKHTGLVPRIMYMLGLKNFYDVQHDYSHNEADEELKGILKIYMNRKIDECNVEIDGYFCDGVTFGGKSIDEIQNQLDNPQKD